MPINLNDCSKFQGAVICTILCLAASGMTGLKRQIGQRVHILPKATPVSNLTDLGFEQWIILRSLLEWQFYSSALKPIARMHLLKFDVCHILRVFGRNIIESQTHGYPRVMECIPLQGILI